MERRPLEIVFPGGCWGPQVLPGEMEGAVGIPHPAQWQGQRPLLWPGPLHGGLYSVTHEVGSLSQ